MILQNGKRIDGCSDTVPVGTLQPYLGLIPPKGYLACQGQLVSKITYSKLYEICGDTFGVSTDTHFYLPDLRGKTLAGYDENDAAMNTIGKLLGQKTHTHTSAAHTHSTGNHTLTVAEIPGHNHTQSTGYSSLRYKNGSTYMPVGFGSTTGGPAAAFIVNGTATGSASVTEWSLVGTVGGGGAHNHGDTGSTTPNDTGTNTNYQPTITVNWIVKAVMLIPDYIIVEDTLNSDSAVDALSARQGKLLNEKFTDYATKSEMIQYLPLSGGTLNGAITLPLNKYVTQDSYGIDVNNSDIIGVNGIYWGDASDSQSEGLHFYKGIVDNVVKYDSLMGYKGELIWIPNNDTNTSVHKTEYKMLGTHNTSDYVIEQGTTSGWRYRKWNTGVTEAWAVITKNVAVNNAEGQLFYGTCNIDIPSGLFSKAPVANITVCRTGGYGAYYTIGSISKTSCNGWIFADLSRDAADHYLNIQLIGQYN